VEDFIIPENNQIITAMDIANIRKKFVGKINISCDEYHAHNFDCADFENETAKVIERLIVEINKYKRDMYKIRQIGVFWIDG